MYKKINPCVFITVGFLICIIIGGLLLFAPISHQNGVEVSIIDAFFIAISAICVTGLSTVDVANTFNLFGVSVIGLLIQIGGLGIVCAGLSLVLLARQKIGIKERILIKDSLNLSSLKGVVNFVLTVFKVTFTIELVGAILSFIVFINYYNFREAAIVSLFHSVSSFNNAGFDLCGNFNNLLPFSGNLLLTVVTSLLIVLGGLGFLVINELIKKPNFKKLSFHSKVVIQTTVLLIISGTLLLKFSQDISWLNAMFMSISARTAGFNTFPMESFNKFGLFVLMIFMFIGASPSSTGGGIKTTTFYTLMKGTAAICKNKPCHAFKRLISEQSIIRAFVVLFLGLAIVCFTTLGLCIFENDMSFVSLLFEAISSFGTVGLSVGITPLLKIQSKIIIMITMFIGRVGPLTLLSIWLKKGKRQVTYPEETIIIG